MENKKEIVFTDGLFIKRPKEGTPKFVKAKCSAKAETFIPWLQKHTNAEGYVNFDILKSDRTGNLYGKLDDWAPEGSLSDEEKAQLAALKSSAPEKKESDVKLEDIPF